MIIRLPRKFLYIKDDTCAYVRNGILYIEGNINFERLMYEITYTLKGREKCLYCKNPMTSSKRTIDHMNPRTYGGISIPENLIPCCKKCNKDKKDMTADQYREWMRLCTQKEKDIFFEKCIKKNFYEIQKRKYLIPRKWITKYDISKVYKFTNFGNSGKSKYYKVDKYFSIWRRYKEPIILSKNEWVLEGKSIIQHAKKQGIRKVDAIILENVVVKKDSK